MFFSPGVFNTTGFQDFSPDLASAKLLLVSISAVCGTFGALLFVVTVNRAGPSRAIILRWLQLVLVFVLRVFFGSGGKDFWLSDLAASALIGIAVSHVIVDLLFY
jgi:hypothetical protein